MKLQLWSNLQQSTTLLSLWDVGGGARSRSEDRTNKLRGSMLKSKEAAEEAQDGGASRKVEVALRLGLQAESGDCGSLC